MRTLMPQPTRYRRNFRCLLGAALCLATVACQPAEVGGGASWLRGTTDQRLETVAKQLRGLDVAMVEIGYRYEELYWAGEDENWEYAAYQIQKIRLALDNALVRRPKREKSTKAIFDPVLTEIEGVLELRDSERFSEQFEALTAACNICHAVEQVPTFRVVSPEQRHSPIRWSQ